MLGLVVVSYGSGGLLRENLAGLDRAALAVPTLVVVVDNLRTASARAEVEALAARQGWDLLRNDANLGFGAAANQGVAHAARQGCTSVAVVNPDLAVTPAVLDALAEQTARTPRTLVTPRVVRPGGRPWFSGGALDLERGWTRNREQAAEPVADGWLTGACLATTTAFWRELGGFDEDYFLYWEDVDLSYRATRRGGTLLVRQDLEVVHDVGGTQRGTDGPGGTRGDADAGGKSPAYVFHNCRNRMLFAVKHLPAPVVRRWAAGAPAYARAVVLRGGRRRLLRSPATVRAAVSGTLAGLAAARSARRSSAHAAGGVA